MTTVKKKQKPKKKTGAQARAHFWFCLLVFFFGGFDLGPTVLRF